MKSTIVLITFLALTRIVFCQDCDFFNNEKVDSVSGLPVKMQKVGIQSDNKVGARHQVWLFFSTNHKWIHLNVNMDRNYGADIRYFDIDPIILFFNDGTTLELYPSKDYPANSSFQFMYYTKNDNVIYTVTKEDLAILTTKIISKVKIYYTKGIDDRKRKKTDPLNNECKEIKIAKGERVQSRAKCIENIFD